MTLDWGDYIACFALAFEVVIFIFHTRRINKQKRELQKLQLSNYKPYLVVESLSLYLDENEEWLIKKLSQNEVNYLFNSYKNTLSYIPFREKFSVMFNHLDNDEDIYVAWCTNKVRIHNYGGAVRRIEVLDYFVHNGNKGFEKLKIKDAIINSYIDNGQDFIFYLSEVTNRGRQAVCEYERYNDMIASYKPQNGIYDVEYLHKPFPKSNILNYDEVIIKVKLTSKYDEEFIYQYRFSIKNNTLDVEMELLNK